MFGGVLTFGEPNPQHTLSMTRIICRLFVLCHISYRKSMCSLLLLRSLRHVFLPVLFAHYTLLISLLYFTTVILAHRPLWSIPAYYHVCISAAQSIEKLLFLLESTFGLENITYLMGYCIYTGASAILEDAKNNDGVANVTMQTYLRAFNTGMRRCPLFERSLHIIVKGLKSTPV